MNALPRPNHDEHDPYYRGYVSEAPGDDVLRLLDDQRARITALGALPDPTGNHAYQPGKWTVKDVLGHLADAERIFAYRALRIARGDTTDLPGFDENAYVPAGDFARRTVGNVAGELLAAREASLALFRSFTAEQAARRGTANQSPCSARAIPWIIAGHFAHHVGVLRERYGVTV
jgi:hypothetical protein